MSCKRLESLATEVLELAGEHAHARRTLRDEKKALAAAKRAREVAEEARHVLQTVAQAVQQRAHEQIAKVVSRCLKTVFGADAYGFEVTFERRRGKTEAEFWFTRKGARVRPLTASGGGVVDVAAFALRLACLLLSTPARRRLLVLDEAFQNLSRNYAPRVRELLETLSKELKIQIIQVTHDPQLVCGKVIEVR